MAARLFLVNFDLIAAALPFGWSIAVLLGKREVPSRNAGGAFDRGIRDVSWNGLLFFSASV